MSVLKITEDKNMSFFEMHYKSEALRSRVTVNVILPEYPQNEEKSFKTLYLLHGLSGDQNDWIRYTSIERYAKDHNVAVVMPSVGRSWYADTAYGANYFTFVADELPRVCRSYFKGMSDAREDNYVGGLSMGGYGALKLAMTFPERYAGCISMSGSLDITRKGRAYILEEWRGNFGFDIENADALEGSDNDLFALTRRAARAGKDFPKFYFWCGTDDVLIKVNREYRDLLGELGADLVYTESEGDHSWKWWDKHIQPALEHFFPIAKNN